MLCIRLIVTLVLILALLFSFLGVIKKKKVYNKVFLVISLFMILAIVLNFSDIYFFGLKPETAVVIAETINKNINSITFNDKSYKSYEISFDDDNIYSVYCAPFSESILDTFISENFYSLAYEFQYDSQYILIAPTVYHFDNSYYIGYHEKPTQRILCYNEEVIIEIQYTSHEYRDEPWKDTDFEYVLQGIN